MKQRLALFLDGTWNTEDDSTNVLHAYNLTQDGIVKDKKTEEDILQKRYYDRGVGTGIMDSVLGGAFGIGLENNVREAYNWLVDHYNDCDEIYIFGFSRGAFTARALMGFIANCGLVRRGAPLTVSQLWQGNRLIGQVRDRQTRIDKSKLLFRRISSIKEPPQKNAENPQKIEEHPQIITEEELQKNKEKYPKNITEELLIKWSRRVDITYMGIFDTVSALGLDALGIPGLSSKMALNHNQNPSGILQSCRHALAIDENRNSFRLTPIRHFIEKSAKKEDLNPFKDRIKQKWFVGAHSNIGGGYSDNILANRPLGWIIYGAIAQGLVIEKERAEKGRSGFIASTLPNMSNARDSHADFGIFWNDIIRAKRHYRPIALPDEVTSEFTWRPINERIDKSVLRFLQTNEEEQKDKDASESKKEAKFYAPPNLLAYLDSLPEKIEEELEEDSCDDSEISLKKDIDIAIDYELKAYYEKEEIKKKTEKLSHDWLQRTKWSAAIFIVWVTLAVIGFDFWLEYFLSDMVTLNHWGKAILATIFVLVDWTESLSNWRAARFPQKILPKVIRMVMRLVSLVGVMSFFTGVVYFSFQIWDFGISNPFDFESIISPFKTWIFIPAAAGISMLLIAILEKFITQKSAEILMAILKGLFIFACMSGAIFLLSRIIDHLTGAPSPEIELLEATAGMFLFCLILLMVLYSAFNWVGKPMNIRTRIGKISSLQWAASPIKVTSTFDNWKNKLTQDWAKDYKSESAVKAEVKAVIEESLWRDILGFIPIFTAVFGIILWIGAQHGIFANWTLTESLNSVIGIPFWLMLISVTAIADYCEDFIHLKHLKNYMKDKNISGTLAFTGYLANVIKMAGFLTSFLLSAYVTLHLAFEIGSQTGGGWKWFLGTCIIIFSILSTGAIIFKWIKQKITS